jgi:hypothetical protein
MARIGETEWDNELLTDRVDVFRAVSRKAASGQSLPTFVPVRSDVPCKIFYGSGRGRSEITPTVNLAIDQAIVGFAEDVSLANRDKLTPKSPSIGNDLIVSLYRYDSDLHLYAAICTQTP